MQLIYQHGVYAPLECQRRILPRLQSAGTLPFVHRHRAGASAGNPPKSRGAHPHPHLAGDGIPLRLQR